jgi:hypothetical protein
MKRFKIPALLVTGILAIAALSQIAAAPAQPTAATSPASSADSTEPASSEQAAAAEALETGLDTGVGHADPPGTDVDHQFEGSE